MAQRSKFSSPTLVIPITDETWATAKQSSSGACLIADGIRANYPQFSRVDVDMATVRITDPAKGVRYTYLTPELAQMCLLSFDQGWRRVVDEVTIKRAVKILPITRARTGSTSAVEIGRRRGARIAELEAKQADQTLTRRETAILTRMQNAPPPVERPSGTGPVEARVRTGGSDYGVVLYGGQPLMQGKPHPNLLRGRNRHFGARMADPGEAFNEAVDKAVAEKLAERVEAPPSP